MGAIESRAGGKMDERWIWASVAVAAGVVVGAVAGAGVRRMLGRPGGRGPLREVAGPLSLFVFWLSVATGIVIAVAVSSPETLKPIPADILGWLPDVAIAGLLLIGGYALGLMVAAALGRPFAHVAGRSGRALERLVKAAFIGGAGILALSQLGVDTTVIDILVAGLVLTTAAALAGLSVVGGRVVAANVAAGRALSGILAVGVPIRLTDVEGLIVELDVAHLTMETGEGRLVVPYETLMQEPFLLPSSPDQSAG
jgi:hypothetical protein